MNQYHFKGMPDFNLIIADAAEKDVGVIVVEGGTQALLLTNKPVSALDAVLGPIYAGDQFNCGPGVLVTSRLHGLEGHLSFHTTNSLYSNGYLRLPDRWVALAFFDTKTAYKAARWLKRLDTLQPNVKITQYD